VLTRNGSRVENQVDYKDDKRALRKNTAKQFCVTAAKAYTGGKHSCNAHAWIRWWGGRKRTTFGQQKRGGGHLEEPVVTKKKKNPG